jgi:hypothetical protein
MTAVTEPGAVGVAGLSPNARSKHLFDDSGEPGEYGCGSSMS